MDDGGRAFATLPRTVIKTEGGNAYAIESRAEPGMTLLDYFASRYQPTKEELSFKRSIERNTAINDKTRKYQERDDSRLRAEIRYEEAAAMIAEKRRRESQ